MSTFQQKPLPRFQQSYTARNPSDVARLGDHIKSLAEDLRNHPTELYDLPDLINLIHTQEWSFALAPIAVPEFCVYADDTPSELCGFAHYQKEMRKHLGPGRTFFLPVSKEEIEARAILKSLVERGRSAGKLETSDTEEQKVYYLKGVINLWCLRLSRPPITDDDISPFSRTSNIAVKMRSTFIDDMKKYVDNLNNQLIVKEQQRIHDLRGKLKALDTNRQTTDEHIKSLEQDLKIAKKKRGRMPKAF